MGLGLTQLDFIVLALLAISGGVGFVRGAVREVASLVALLVAAAVAVFGLPVFAPVAREVIRPGWLGSVIALVVVFGVTYVLLRMLGAIFSRRVHDAEMLGALDRSVGVVIGLGRGLLVLGVLYLMFNAATPRDLRPRWITGAATWPLAGNMAKLLEGLAPQGLHAAERLKPAFDRAVQDASGDRTAPDRYTPGETDIPPEKSR